MPSCLYPSPSRPYNGVIVHIERKNCRSAARRESKYQRVGLIPGKMLGPFLFEWMKQSCLLTCFGVDCTLARVLMVVTGGACQAQVFCFRFTPLRLGDDVIGLQPDSAILLEGLTIGTAVVVSLRYQPAKL